MRTRNIVSLLAPALLAGALCIAGPNRKLGQFGASGGGGGSITWGDGLQYSAPTASADINATNLKITAGEINLIQDLHTTSTPTFGTLTLTANSDTITLGHDGTDANFTTTDGVFNFYNSEGGGIASIVEIHGNGTIGALRALDEDDAEWCSIHATVNEGYITVGGSAPGDLNLVWGGASDVEIAHGVADAETPYLGVYGFPTGTAVHDIKLQLAAGPVGQITSSTGTIDFADENLTTLGELSVGSFETPWDNIIVVDAGGGGDYTTIQAGVNAAASGDVVKIAPGTYSENVVMADDVSLCGMSCSKEQVIITAATGTVLTTQSGTGGEFSSLRIVATGTAEALNIPAGATGKMFSFWNCDIEGDYTSRADDMITVNSGLFRLSNCAVEYNEAGNATATVTHRVINVVGANAVYVLNSRMTMDVDDTNANNATLIEIASGANCGLMITSSFFEQDVEATGTTAIVHDKDAHGATGRMMWSTHADVDAAGAGTATAYVLDNIATTFRSVSNLIHVTGGTKYLGNLGAAATLVSNGDDITGVTVDSETTGAGTYTQVNSPSDDVFSVSGDIHASYIEFDDAENSYIGADKTWTDYFAFANDETNFWLGTAADPQIYMNYERDANILVGAGTGGDTDIIISEGNTNKTTLNQSGIDFKVSVGVTNGDIDLEPNGTGTVDIAGGMSATGVSTFTFPPTGNTAATASLAVNPASATAAAGLLWLGVNDAECFAVDEDGKAWANAVSGRSASGTGAGVFKVYAYSNGNNGATLELSGHGANNTWSAWALTSADPSADRDVTTTPCRLVGVPAHPSATANKVGGPITITGGAGDGAAAQTAAHGGDVHVVGGAAASDLDSSDGGDVKLYPGELGTNGTPGVDGSVAVYEADGTTPVATFNDLTGVTHNQRTVYTPSADQARADDSTITVANTIVRVAGDAGAAVLDTNPAIEDGAADGQMAIIQGTHDTNTVQIADACNTQLAGGAAVTLGQGDTLTVIWDAGESVWLETSRSNN
ncbi:MAG: hypothetical protein GY851_35375 [bacterium]|nr:hypothetical protein [bacterium]